jgi:hypothetical protein
MSATRSDAHTLTTREVMKIFEAAGIPRAQRSIERYCQNGDLDCMPDAIEKRQYITRDSVDALLGQLKEIAARHPKVHTNVEQHLGATSDDNPRQPATSAAGDAVKRGTPEKQTEKQAAGEEELEAMKVRIKELEDKNFTLEIDKRARDQMMGMLREEMTKQVKVFAAEITQQAQRVGQLETEMRQLQAPNADTHPTRDDSATREVGEPIDAEFTEASGSGEHESNHVQTNHAQQP